MKNVQEGSRTPMNGHPMCCGARKLRSAALLMGLPALLALATLSQAQESPAPNVDAHGGIRLTPSMAEIEVAAGVDATFLMYIDYNRSVGEPQRMLASFSDWSMNRTGDTVTYPPGQQAGSAVQWITYSPAEFVLAPGKRQPIRVTVSVPKDATPGDHLAAFAVEPRPESNKTRTRQMTVRMRMVSWIIVKVGPTVKQGVLKNVRVVAGTHSLSIVPTIQNTGNTILWPKASYLIESNGARLQEGRLTDVPAVLANGESEKQYVVPSSLAAGRYTLRLRVDLGFMRRAIEGVTEVIIPGTTNALEGGVPGANREHS